jgi:hypothetical protein
MRLISFALTTRQFRDGSKDVTRRLGWKKLKAGERLQAVRKAMGLKHGEHVEKLGVIEVVSVRRERLDAINGVECIREGFEDLTPDEFVSMFCEHMGCKPSRKVTRIEFRKVMEGQ